MNKQLKGRSLLISVDNNYAGFYFKFESLNIRLCLGYIAITYFKVSEEILLGDLVK
jgi:hypothetical protein